MAARRETPMTASSEPEDRPKTILDGLLAVAAAVDRVADAVGSRCPHCQALTHDRTH